MSVGNNELIFNNVFESLPITLIFDTTPNKSIYILKIIY